MVDGCGRSPVPVARTASSSNCRPGITTGDPVPTVPGPGRGRARSAMPSHLHRDHRAGRWARRALLVTGVISLAGCGVPVDKQPSALSRHGIPFDLLQPNPSTTTATTTPSPVEVPVQIFLIGPTGHLAPVTRDVSGSTPDLPTVLEALVAGPTDAESARGLQSALTTQTTVL